MCDFTCFVPKITKLRENDDRDYDDSGGAGDAWGWEDSNIEVWHQKSNNTKMTEAAVTHQQYMLNLIIIYQPNQSERRVPPGLATFSYL